MWFTAWDRFSGKMGHQLGRGRGEGEESEDIVLKLGQGEVLHGQGMAMAQAVRRVGEVQQTFYRWCRLYGGMGCVQCKRLKELERTGACAGARREKRLSGHWHASATSPSSRASSSTLGRCCATWSPHHAAGSSRLPLPAVVFFELDLRKPASIPPPLLPASLRMSNCAPHMARPRFFHQEPGDRRPCRWCAPSRGNRTRRRSYGILRPRRWCVLRR